ncbi:unnamed protein product [Adineta ricciae]|uniref:Poly [ADP-ribose] polymerase n=1 Tax=Adineta ricciae TaxID=249248 RepID=A0A814H769_ADIRI|nr:unnamed protein product [Adineta ricciae]
MGVLSSPLNGKTFVLELGRDVRFKAKQELINYLREQHAQISYILTASTDYVLVSNDIDTYKTRRAKQLGIPLVNVDYIHEYRKSTIGKESIDIKRFIVTSAEDKENFSKTGTIPVAGGGSSSSSVVKPVKFDVSKVRIWNHDDVELPRFDEITHAEIGKWAIFKETNDHSDVYFALELQIIPEEYFYQQANSDYQFRFRYEKQTIVSSKGKTSVIQYAFSNDINELHQLFASYYYRIATMPRITRIRDLLPDKLGSKLLLRSLFLHRIDTQMLNDDVCQLIESLWIESIGDLNKLLTVPPESIALKAIIEAEAALLEIKSNDESASEAQTRFYSLIPHRQPHVVDLVKNRRTLIDKIDLCQMLRDMLTINELTNWNIKASIEAKYRALKCHIESIEKDSHEYATINSMIHSSTNSNEEVIVHQIFSVAKQTDALNFRSTLFNQRQLFHGSKYNNFLGILSRGLMLPKLVVDDLGVTRTDFGCLGYGIYFSDSVSTSLKYTTPSTTRPGRRLLCISQVALGESAKYYSYAANLTQAPENFHSTHGIKKTSDNNSKFIDDEYVIYNLDQQRLLYIVEVSWKPHDNTDQVLKVLPIVRDSLLNQLHSMKSEIVVPSSIEDEVIQVAEQDYGLICPSSGQLVPLKAFHIRAQLVDVTAEVVLYQVYHNTSSVPIEAKYVFPLDENCSVCGFEAHINNKVIKGVVKEKEQAKREYREAIEKGHGAYLMHQEQPEVFSVSVGNLPANCEVVIKITYVAELPIENNDIIFRFPAKVASWQSKQALESKDQTILPSISLERDDSLMKSVEFSLKASVRMPYEISKLFSPTHRLRRKVTDCVAMIEMVDNVLLDKDFLLSIALKNINVPRMLNETYTVSDENNNVEMNDEQSQACMLTFYPKFEMTTNTNEFVEVIFIIDVSNSMDGQHVQQAKQLAHLFLTNMKNDDANIYFNIVTFGSDNDECFPISLPNTKENIDKAKHFVLHSLDHRGNTDLFTVLRQYSLLPSPCKLGRQFILLSDGHVNDLNSILTLLENQSSMKHDRFFTCSIGDTSNKHQLKQLANGAHGGGLTTVFDSNFRSRWKSKVLLILEHIRQPCVTNISIDWHGTIENEQVRFTNQAPNIIRSLFNGMRLTVYRFIQNCHKATLTAMINDQEFVTTVFSNKMTETKGRILHCLTARAIIHDYENGLLHTDESENELIKKQYKQDLIDLSVKYSVVSSFTSFVAIEERDRDEVLEPGVRLLDVMLESDIDLLPYIGWDGDRSQIEIVKEKLLNAKRSFENASISNKLELTQEYEKLCQNISYRSGGDAKYDLMLAIIDTYRTTLKDNSKALELEEKIQLELSNEVKSATADERKILEKRLAEINARINMAESEISYDNSEDEESGEEDESGNEHLSCLKIACNTNLFNIDDEWCDEGERECLSRSYSLDEERKKDSDVIDRIECHIARATSPVREYCTSPGADDYDDADDSDGDVGWDLFEADKSASVLLTSLSEVSRPMKPTAAAAAAQPVASKEKGKKEAEEEDDEDADCMGFGLFDDFSPLTSLSPVNRHKQDAQLDKAVDPFATNARRLMPDIEEHSLEIAMPASNALVTPKSKSMITSQEKIQVPTKKDRKSAIASIITKKAVLDDKESTTFTETQFPQQQQQQQQIPMNPFTFPQQSFSFGSTNANSLFSNQGAVPTVAQSTPFYNNTAAPPLHSFTAFTFNNNQHYSSSHPDLPSPRQTTTTGTSSFGTLENAASTFSSPNYSPYSPSYPNQSSSYTSVPPPPPSFAVPVPSGLFGSGTSSTSNLFGGFIAPGLSVPPPPPPPPPSQTFGMFGGFAAPGSSVPPPPPPLPPSSPTSGLFGSFVAPGSSVPLPPPPPLRPSSQTSGLFGSFVAPESSVPPPPPLSQTFGMFGSLVASGSSVPPPLCTSSKTSGLFGSFMAPRLSVAPPPPPPPPSQTFGMFGSNLAYEGVPSVSKSDNDSSRSSMKYSFSPSIFEKAQENDALKSVQTSWMQPSGRGRGSASPNASARFCDLRNDRSRTDSIESITFDRTSRYDDLCARKKSKSKLKLESTKVSGHVEDHAQNLLLLDVTPLSLGIEDVNGEMCTIISRNRTIPTRSAVYSIFTNAYAYQTNVVIRVFRGEHRLTKYNTFIGELILKGVTSNFASQTLQISIFMDIDANDWFEVHAEEPRSGAKAMIRIDLNNFKLSAVDIERHLNYVESNADHKAANFEYAQANNNRFMLKGDTENTSVSFTGGTDDLNNLLNFQRPKSLTLTSTVINELKRIQLPNGSFEINEDFAKLFSFPIENFDKLKKYFISQGFNSFALSVQKDIMQLIATGIVLLQLLFQVPVSERKEYLVPFDSEQIKSIFHGHLPKTLIENANKMVDFYKQKRSQCGIYCEQLELKYSSWEKFIQFIMQASPALEKLKGTWEYVDGEHFDDYMKELGVGFALRQSAKLVKPKLIIQENGGKWSLKSESTLKSASYEFKPGCEFDETRLDGENVKSTVKFENDKWVHTMRDKNGKESTITRWVDENGQQQIVMKAGDVTARRWYKRVD